MDESLKKKMNKSKRQRRTLCVQQGFAIITEKGGEGKPTLKLTKDVASVATDFKETVEAQRC